MQLIAISHFWSSLYKSCHLLIHHSFGCFSSLLETLPFSRCSFPFVLYNLPSQIVTYYRCRQPSSKMLALFSFIHMKTFAVLFLHSQEICKPVSLLISD